MSVPRTRPSARRGSGVLTLRMVLAALAASACVAVPVTARAQVQTGQVSVSFAAETETPKPGSTTMLVLRMTPRPGWHGYWRNPGESGGETQLKWSAPKGVTFGRPQWGAPIASQALGMTSYVMEGAYSILVPMTLPKGLKEGEAFSVGVNVLLFVCTEGMCSSQKVDGSVDLVAGDGTPSAVGSPMVAQARGELPRRAEARAALTKEGTVLTVAGTSLDPSRTRIYIADRDAPVGAQRGVGRTDDDALAFDLAWRPKGAFEGVASDGRSSWSFRATPEAGKAPAIVAHASTKPIVTATNGTPQEDRYVAAASIGRHDEPRVENGVDVGWSGVVRAALAAAFLAAAGGVSVLLLGLRRRF